MTDVNDIQYGGDHYKSEFQHWDLISRNGIGYLEGCASKYPTRWRKKNGAEDVQKALHYVDKIISNVADFGYSATGFASDEDLEKFFAANSITDVDEIYAITHLCQWTNVLHLVEAKTSLYSLLDKAKML